MYDNYITVYFDVIHFSYHFAESFPIKIE